MSNQTQVKKYEDLLERAVVAIESQNSVSKSLLTVSRGLKSNMKKVNDNFILHTKTLQGNEDQIRAMRIHLMKWIKWLAIALFVSVGGSQIVKLLLPYIT